MTVETEPGATRDNLVRVTVSIAPNTLKRI